jgi:hypothetical protein
MDDERIIIDNFSFRAPDPVREEIKNNLFGQHGR